MRVLHINKSIDRFSFSGRQKTVNMSIVHGSSVLTLMVNFFSIVDCSCWRSRDKIPNVGYRYGSRSSSVEAIDFQTSSNIILRGYRLWNDRRLFAHYNITIQLYEGNTSIASKSLTYNNRFSSKETFEVYFSRHIYLQAGVNYTAAVRMLQGSYVANNIGMNYNFCSGVNVSFMKSSLKVPKHSSYVHQIPALIFLGLKC